MDFKEFNLNFNGKITCIAFYIVYDGGFIPFTRFDALILTADLFRLPDLAQ
jgi:hypothetical protein